MAEQLKNLYSKEFIKKLANRLFLAFTNFEKEDFINSIFEISWQNLELKQRMRHIAITLNKYLPFSYKKQLEILKEESISADALLVMLIGTNYEKKDKYSVMLIETIVQHKNMTAEYLNIWLDRFYLLA